MSRTLVPFAAALLAGGFAACTATTSTSTGQITIDNQSSFTLTEVHITDVGSRSWGPNLVPQTLAPGDEVDISTFDCGHYDVLVIDETGANCVLSDLDLCFSNDLWVIDDSTLASCAFPQQ
jgi:hypothetical protein